MSSIETAQEIVTDAAREHGIDLNTPLSTGTAPSLEVLGKVAARVERALDDLADSVFPGQIRAHAEGWLGLRQLVGQVEVAIDSRSSWATRAANS